MLAEVFNSHHLFDQLVHAKHRREAFELVQQAVGTVKIVFFQQILDFGQVVAQSLVEGVQQRQNPIGVANEFHGPIHREVGGGGCLRHMGNEESVKVTNCNGL
jgi:hypothetical protein